MKTEFSIGNSRFDITTRARRRWLVGLVYFVIAMLVLAWSSGLFGLAHSYIVIAIVLLAFKFFGTRTSPGALAGFVRAGDERERQRWDRAHSIAYDWISWMLIVALFMAWLRSPNPLVPLLGASSKTIVDNLAEALLMGGLIVYFTIPQAIFLWSEPDMEGAQS